MQGATSRKSIQVGVQQAGTRVVRFCLEFHRQVHPSRATRKLTRASKIAFESPQSTNQTTKLQLLAAWHIPYANHPLAVQVSSELSVVPPPLNCELRIILILKTIFFWYGYSQQPRDRWPTTPFQYCNEYCTSHVGADLSSRSLTYRVPGRFLSHLKYTQPSVRRCSLPNDRCTHVVRVCRSRRNNRFLNYQYQIRI